MAREIWKFPLKIGEGSQHIEMPEDTRILSVQIQHGRLCLWGLVPDTTGLKVRRVFEVMPTGSPVPDSITAEKSVGTVQDSFYVWHVFETTQP